MIARRKADWARLIRKVYEVDTLERLDCGASMRIIAVIDDGDIVERILGHLEVWGPVPDPVRPSGPDPPCPDGETLPSAITGCLILANQRISAAAARPNNAAFR